uniref:Macrophage-expressed gene 1 protein n=1 Tax=Macrostomum lignano TaxID=282301 RepID=A0A1I8HRE6_9PLAT
MCHCLWVILALIGLCCSAGATPVVNLSQSSPAPDGSNRCLWLLNSGASITRFSSMPGGGWDNLRNKDMGLVADLSFTDCTLSDDGMYVLPKNVILYPRKESNVEVMSQVMEHFNNFTSSVSASVNIGANGILGAIGIGGKLSEEFQMVKSVAVQNRLQIGRSQLRYRMYSSKLQPDFKLSVALTNRLTDIVSALVNNRTKLARYLSDLIVRDFGTHVITSVEAGGILEKLDFFRSDSITDRNFMENKFSASMSVKFHQILGVDVGGSTTVTKEDIDKYTKSVRKMMMRSFGGPILGPSPKLADWMKSLHENLVPIDREGEPLYSALPPNLPMTHLMQLRKEIEDAVMRYYKANTVKGCMDPNSQNFDPIANVGGQCEAPASNFSFAGVYQQCRESNPGAGMKLCSGDGNGLLPNPITGKVDLPNWIRAGAYAADGRFVNEITQDLDAASRYRIPFAGFFACNSGNPLSEMNRRLVAYSSSGNGAKSTSPKRCPDSFSQVTLDTIDGCAIMQCVKGRSGLSRLHIRRPPFEEPDYELIEHPVTRIESHGWRWAYNATKNIWRFLGFYGSSSEECCSSSSSSSSNQATPNSRDSGSDTSTAILAIVSCLAAIAAIGLIVLLVRKRARSASAGRSSAATD